MFALLPAWAGAGAAEREWMPYAKLVGTIKLDKFYALPPAARDKVSLYATVAPANKNIPLSELVLTVVHGAGRQALPITADGKLYIVPNPAWIREDAKIWTSLPKSEKVSVGFGMDALLPDGQQWQYSKLMGSVQQGNDLIKSQAGMLSIFMPTLRSVILKFAKPAQLRIEGKDGTKLYASDAKGWIRLKPESAWMREDPAMLVSERPVEAELDTE
ncbi:MAG TPA: hypothetical protein DCW29_03935 [Janthinobacterium sp.]|nr:hypothetical protein [Janthinobacterium sp.]